MPSPRSIAYMGLLLIALYILAALTPILSPPQPLDIPGSFSIAFPKGAEISKIVLNMSVEDIIDIVENAEVALNYSSLLDPSPEAPVLFEDRGGRLLSSILEGLSMNASMVRPEAYAKLLNIAGSLEPSEGSCSRSYRLHPLPPDRLDMLNISSRELVLSIKCLYASPHSHSYPPSMSLAHGDPYIASIAGEASVEGFAEDIDAGLVETGSEHVDLGCDGYYVVTCTSITIHSYALYIGAIAGYRSVFGDSSERVSASYEITGGSGGIYAVEGGYLMGWGPLGGAEAHVEGYEDCTSTSEVRGNITYIYIHCDRGSRLSLVRGLGRTLIFTKALFQTPIEARIYNGTENTLVFFGDGVEVLARGLRSGDIFRGSIALESGWSYISGEKSISLVLWDSITLGRRMHVANRSWVVVGKLFWEPSSREMPGWGSTAKILPRGFITLTPLEPPEWVSIDPGVLNGIYSVNAAQEMIQYSVYRWIHDGIVGFVKDLGISSEYLAWEIHAIASQIPLPGNMALNSSADYSYSWAPALEALYMGSGNSSLLSIQAIMIISFSLFQNHSPGLVYFTSRAGSGYPDPWRAMWRETIVGFVAIGSSPYEIPSLVLQRLGIAVVSEAAHQQSIYAIYSVPGEGEAVRPFLRGCVEMVRGWIWGPRWIAFHVERVFDNVISYRCPGYPQP